MVRLFTMTNTAKQALWSKLSDNSAFIPVMFRIDGDAEEGYIILCVDQNMLGFHLVKENFRIRTLYCVKRIIEHINAVGYPTEFTQLLDMNSFAWHNVQMPLQPTPNCKQLNLSL